MFSNFSGTLKIKGHKCSQFSIELEANRYIILSSDVAEETGSLTKF